MSAALADLFFPDGCSAPSHLAPERGARDFKQLFNVCGVYAVFDHPFCHRLLQVDVAHVL